MEQLVIQKFPFGRDTRRSVLTSQPGTLVTGNNCVVNEGGELELRKAFIQHADLSSVDTGGDACIFGLEVTDSGLTCFGSAISPLNGYTTANGVASSKVTGSGLGATFNITAVNGVVTAATVNAGGAGYANGNILVIYQSASIIGALLTVASVSAGAVLTVTVLDSHFFKQPVVAASIPAGYTYQQLKHPALTDSYLLDGYAGANRVTYDRAKHRITLIPWSNNYDGKSFVAATFSDGNTFLYYDGSYVEQSGAGVLWSSFASSVTQTNRYIVYQAGKQFTRLDSWTNLTNLVDPKNEPDANLQSVGIGCSVGDKPFSMSLSLSSTSDKMTTVVGLASTAVTASGNATATFTVAGSAGKTYAVYGPVLDDYGGPVESVSGRVYTSLMSPETVTWGVDNTTTAAAIVTAINALTLVTGFAATNNLGVVTVTAPIPTTPLIGSTSPIASRTDPLTLIVTQPTILNVVSTDAGANGAHAWSFTPYTNAFGQRGNINVYGTNWVTGDSWTITASAATTGPITIGKGNISSQPWGFGFQFGARQFVCFGSFFAGSSVAAPATNAAENSPVEGDPTGWEDQDVGAIKVSYINQYGSSDTVKGMAAYQGRIAVFATQSVQIWQAPADPDQFSRQQTLPNIGTESGFSIQNYGELDVFFIASTGFRSLRVRDQSLNAMVVDIGTPINSIVKAYTHAERAASISILEPDLHRYWCFVKDTIHVLSYFPELKIQAWTSFSPTYANNLLSGLSYDINHLLTGIAVTPGNQYVYINKDGASTSSVTNGSTVMTTNQLFTAAGSTLNAFGPATQPVQSEIWEAVTFTPQKFLIFSGQIYVRATSGKVYQYGGTANATYDASLMTVELPWLSHNKPRLIKQSVAVDLVAQGQWSGYGSMDPKSFASSGVLTQFATNQGSATAPSIEADSPLDEGLLRYQAQGTHVKFRFIGFSDSSSVPAKLSEMVWRYNDLTTKR